MVFEWILEKLWGQVDTFEVVDNYKYEGPKNIVISFDGTGGEPQWAVQAKESMVDGEVPLYASVSGLSNVCKLHLMAGGNIGNSRNFFEDQLPFYYSGVGTRGSEIGQKIRSLPLYSSGLAMDYIAKNAWEDLAKVYKEGDKIFVFGFSRGAATARLFCSYLSKNPIKDGIKIEFLGVYDTVPQSMKYGTSNDIKDMDIYDRKDSKMPEIVKKAVHFVAIDEYRQVMNPTLFNKDERVTEIWCPGCHSDIGGGYYHDGLSDTFLNCMRMVAQEAGLRIRTITEETCKNEDATILDPKVKGLDADSFKNFDKDMQVKPWGLDPDVHDESTSFAMRLVNRLKGFKHRKLCVTDKDVATDEPILLMDIAVERAKELTIEKDLGADGPPSYVTKKYRPQHLKGIKYKIVNHEDMSISETVYTIEEQVDDW